MFANQSETSCYLEIERAILTTVLSSTHKTFNKQGCEMLRVDSHESFLQLSATIITIKRKKTLDDSQEKFEQVDIR